LVRNQDHRIFIQPNGLFDQDLISYCFGFLASITSENAPSLQLFGQYQFTHAGVFHKVGYKQGRYLDVTFLERISPAPLVDFPRGASFTPFPWGNYRHGLE
jgi:phosphinothricin acetyltransferase